MNADLLLSLNALRAEAQSASAREKSKLKAGKKSLRQPLIKRQAK